MFERVLLFGYGTMASAMLEGWLASGLEPGLFTVYNPRPKPVPAGVAYTDRLPSGDFDAIVLGVKPQKLAEVAAQANDLSRPDTVIVSILAGVELATLARLLPGSGAQVRLMPNLAVALNKSPNALVAQGLTANQRHQVSELATRLGSAEWLQDEAQFDLVTALAGSGPAFVYRFIDALAAAAAGMGLDREQADRLAVRMVDGAAALAVSSDRSPADLARRVASPGGMTQEGLDVLDDGRALEVLLTRCLTAARDKGKELAAAAR